MLNYLQIHEGLFIDKFCWGVGSGDMLPWENLRKPDFLWTPFSIFHGGERKYRAVKRRSKSQSLDQI